MFFMVEITDEVISPVDAQSPQFSSLESCSTLSPTKDQTQTLSGNYTDDFHRSIRMNMD
jgi:hypothetical protein